MRDEWVGPFQIKTYLENAITKEAVWEKRWPRERDGVYLVSERKWDGTPTVDAHVLYIGSTTGESSRFVTRVGDLIADMHGFYGGDTGHHSGGQTLWQWCFNRRVHPGELWLAWTPSTCTRCDERRLYEAFPRATRDDFASHGLLNKKSPPGCSAH